jgi:hypothetical protein
MYGASSICRVAGIVNANSTPATPDLLAVLKDRGDRAIIYANGVDAATRRRFESPTLKFEAEPLDLRKTARESDLAVLNAGHGATAEVLLAGKPVFLLPLVLEQSLVARAVKNLGDAEAAAPKDATSFGPKLDALLLEKRFGQAARSFARPSRYLRPTAERRDVGPGVGTAAREGSVTDYAKKRDGQVKNALRTAETLKYAIGEAHAAEILSQWEGIGRFCREVLRVEPQTLLTAYGLWRDDPAAEVLAGYPDVKADEANAAHWAVVWRQNWERRFDPRR